MCLSSGIMKVGIGHSWATHKSLNNSTYDRQDINTLWVPSSTNASIGSGLWRNNLGSSGQFPQCICNMWLEILQSGQLSHALFSMSLEIFMMSLKMLHPQASWWRPFVSKTFVCIKHVLSVWIRLLTIMYMLNSHNCWDRYNIPGICLLYLQTTKMADEDVLVLLWVLEDRREERK